MKTIFNQKYNRDNFLEFLENHLLPEDFKIEEENVTNDISFSSNRIEKITYLGHSNVLDLSMYEIMHKSEFDPRVSLSKEAFRMMANFSKRKALIFFVPESLSNYRFSLITIDLDIKGKKIQRLYSNPRRYSFLLGSDAKLGTIFEKLLNSKNIEKTKRISEFNDLKERFSVESVSKQFFTEYKELYEKIKVTFEKIPNFKIVESKHIESDFIELFSRKLLGQIVFIYFLQKKKWLGGDPSNKEWHDGKLNFLNWAFNYCAKNNLNFFDKFLEKLFYSGFNEKGASFEFDGMFIKVPFLNGGLFEKFYSSDETLILHPPNTLFSNEEETGILDILDKYNFTIDENTFFEQEVAVDPEMLGKVFENLLPENLRKGKGAFYTPREIVSYMTRESLINYLKTKLNSDDTEILEEKIRHLFNYKDYYISKKESEELDFEKQFYELLDIVEDVIKHLKSIKIVDPAVGSGAFPMGFLLEIVSLREYIEREFLDNRKVSNYALKKETIQNSIYGVDIDPGAIEIAKLRFWLSLVVDADEPEALPNLDYKIMQGNSLIESFAGINFGDKKETDKIETEKEQVRNLRLKQKELYECIDAKSKAVLRNEIEEIIIQIYHSQIEKQKEDYWLAKQHLIKIANSLGNDDLRKEYIKKNDISLQKRYRIDFSEIDKILHNFSKKDRIRPFFPWHLYFADVFNDNAGFDIVIGNPPYLKERDNADVFNPVNKSEFGKKYHCGKMDYWYYFLHKAIQISKENSIITYITSRYWLNSAGAKKIIKHVEEKLSFIDVIDIGKLKVFDNVVGHHMIAQYIKNKTHNYFTYKTLENCLDDIQSDFNTINIQISILQNSNVFINNEILFVLQRFKLKNCIPLGDICHVSQGVVEAPDKLSKKMLKENNNPDFQVGDGVFVLSDIELSGISLSQDEQNTIKNYLDPNDVSKYEINYSNKYLIYSDSEIKKKIEEDTSYHSIKAHLDKYRKFITSSNAPYGLHRSREKRFFESPKIVFKNMFDVNEFCYDDESYYFGFSFSSIIKKNKSYDLKFILAILNSRFALHWFYTFGKQRGVGVDIGVKKLRMFPIKINDNKQQPFIQIVNRIIEYKKANVNTQTLENKLDLMVYKLYDLNYKEVKTIDAKFDDVLSEFDLSKADFERISVEEMAKLT